MARRPVPEPLRMQPVALRNALRHATAGELRGPRYVTPTSGVRWPADEPMTYGRRIQSFREVIPRDAVLAGLSAAWAMGCRLADADDEVLVILAADARVRCRSGLRVRSWGLRPDEIHATGLGPATTPARTAADVLRTLPRVRAVMVADGVLRAGGSGVTDVQAVLDRMRGRRGVAVASARLMHVNPAAESPRETLLRLLLEEAGLPRPVPQYEARDADGRFIARLDLAWPALRVAVEYDGAHHREQGQHSRDLARHNRLRAGGWVVVQVDARSVTRPAELVAQVSAVLASRGGPLTGGRV